MFYCGENSETIHTHTHTPPRHFWLDQKSHEPPATNHLATQDPSLLKRTIQLTFQPFYQKTNLAEQNVGSGVPAQPYIFSKIL